MIVVAVGVDAAAAGLAGLDLADGGEELPGQVAAGLGFAQRGLGLLVGVEDGRGYARLGLARAGRAFRRPSGRRGRAVERRQVGVVRRVAGGAVVGVGSDDGLGAGVLSALAVSVTPGAWDADSAATATAATAVVAAPLTTRLPNCAAIA